MGFPDAAWVGLFAAGAGFEAVQMWRSRHGVDRGTLSWCVRRTFRTDTTTGRCVFTAVWAGFAAWIHRHILTGPQGATA